MTTSLLTLYIVGLGTLAVASAMMFWERRFNPSRRRELSLWAGGYLLLAIGCMLLFLRDTDPRVLAYGFSNLFIVSGYVALLAGTLPFVGLRLPAWAPRGAVPLALAWLVLGPLLPAHLWSAVGGTPVAIVCFTLAGVLVRRGAASVSRAGILATAVFGLHGLVYAARLFVHPVLVLDGHTDGLENLAFFTMFEGVLFSMSAPMALLSLTREESRQQLVRASQTDFLTGLDNRRAFFSRTEAFIAAQKTDAAADCALVLFDLDHFKQVNDLHGHETGDEVLRIFARVASAGLRPQDVIARLGGEEFAAFLPELAPQDARQRLQSIALGFAREVGEKTQVTSCATFSAGVVTCRHGMQVADRLNEADRLLYRAKHLGRNRVEFEPHPDETATETVTAPSSGRDMRGSREGGPVGEPNAMHDRNVETLPRPARQRRAGSS